LSRYAVIAVAAAIWPYRAVREENAGAHCKLRRGLRPMPSGSADGSRREGIVSGEFWWKRFRSLWDFRSVRGPPAAGAALDSSMETTEQSREKIWTALKNLGLIICD
jgi:hypothetical protein